MKFDSIEQLQKDFKKGMRSLPDAISVEDIDYHKSDSTDWDTATIVSGHKKPMVIFSLDQKPANVERFKKVHKNADADGPQDRLVFIWAAQNMHVHPSAVRFVSKNRMQMTTVREAEVADDRIISHQVDIVLQGFNGNQPIKAKVDTGAGMCSLDANNVQVNPKAGTVSFTFGDKKVTMASIETHAFQTADGGIENRPIVVFDVMVPNNDPEKKNKVVRKVKFNLNDRSDMPDRVLLGQNFIKQGDFVIMSDHDDGKVIEGIDWEALSEMFNEVEADPVDSLDDAVDKILRAVKTKVVENLEY